VSRSEPQASKSEAAFLAQQAADAKIAIKQTLEEMQKTAKEAADISWWTRRYPWAAVGTAALVGFVAIPVLTMERAPRTQTTATRNGQAATPSLLSSLFDMVRGVIITSVTTALNNKRDQRDQVERPTTATWPE
jgi:ElaB/YqjD/DUF883 family membrane-anchored ribosome-binding protein